MTLTTVEPRRLLKWAIAALRLRSRSPSQPAAAQHRLRRQRLTAGWGGTICPEPHRLCAIPFTIRRPVHRCRGRMARRRATAHDRYTVAGAMVSCQ